MDPSKSEVCATMTPPATAAAARRFPPPALALGVLCLLSLAHLSAAASAPSPRRPARAAADPSPYPPRSLQDPEECGTILDPTAGTSRARYCQRGAPCLSTVDSSGSRRRRCDCSRAAGTEAYAGEECEYEATSYCGGGGEVQRWSFCANGGTCRDANGTDADDAHPGCDCPPDYEGPHCEYLLGSSPSSDSSPFAASSELAMKFLASTILVLISFVVVCVLYTLMRQSRERRAERRMLEAAADSTAELALDPRGSFMDLVDDHDDDHDHGEDGSRRRRETELTRKGGRLYSGVGGAGGAVGGVGGGEEASGAGFGGVAADENEII